MIGPKVLTLWDCDDEPPFGAVESLAKASQLDGLVSYD
jgi:hypothetical protein